MKAYTYALVISMFSMSSLFSQKDQALSLAAGGCESQLEGREAMGMNTAGAAWKNHRASMFNYGHQGLIKALDRKSVHASFCRNGKAAGFDLGQMGDGRLRMTSAGIWTSAMLSKGFSLSLRLRIEDWKFSDPYGRKTRVEADFGIRARLSDEVFLDGMIVNLNRATVIKALQERSPITARTGLCYRPSALLNMALDLVMLQDKKSDVRIGINYLISESLKLRMGYSGLFHRPSAGFGLNVRSIQFNVSMSYQALLPNYYSLTVLWNFKGEG